MSGEAGEQHASRIVPIQAQAAFNLQFQLAGQHGRSDLGVNQASPEAEMHLGAVNGPLGSGHWLIGRQRSADETLLSCCLGGCVRRCVCHEMIIPVCCATVTCLAGFQAAVCSFLVGSCPWPCSLHATSCCDRTFGRRTARANKA